LLLPLGKVRGGFFLDVSLFSDATQLSFQPSGFRVLINLNAVA